MKKVLAAMMVVMAILTGAVWYAKKNNIKLPGIKPQAPVTNWQWSNDWNNPADPNGSTGPTNPVVPPPVAPPTQPQPTKPAEFVLMGYNDAMKKSAEEGKPVIVMFTASWCTWCNKFKKEVLTDANVKAACSKYLFTMVDADQEKVAVRKFGVTGLPTFVITNSKEEKLKVAGQYMDAPTFIKWLDNPGLMNQPKAEPKKDNPTQPVQPPQQPNNRRQPFRQPQQPSAPPGNC
jgi:thiol-disulfide isomerase/thioredoxin